MQKDTQRAIFATKKIFDGRGLEQKDEILVTLEHVIATTLVVLYGGNLQKATQMLNEGLVPGTENRIALFYSKESQK